MYMCFYHWDLTSSISYNFWKASEASFNKVVQLLSERRSHEVDFFNLNGFESGMKGLLKWHIQPGKKKDCCS